jgi:hypothetical protein
MLGKIYVYFYELAPYQMPHVSLYCSVSNHYKAERLIGCRLHVDTSSDSSVITSHSTENYFL